jgi:hypothetical protein
MEHTERTAARSNTMLLACVASEKLISAQDTKCVPIETYQLGIPNQYRGLYSLVSFVIDGT